MANLYLPVITFLLITGSFITTAKEVSFWPNNTVAAVSLSYDDALDSQLDNALPQLNKYKLKASFYLTLSSAVFQQRKSEWQVAASQGHELGNHTIYHACRRSLPNREWVSPHNDLDNKTMAQLVSEVKLANKTLQNLDNQTVRTFSLPCTDSQTKDGNYLVAVSPMFIAVQSNIGPVVDTVKNIQLNKLNVISASGLSGDEMINYVKVAHKNGTMVNFNFHGIGGDYLTTATKEHDILLRFLAKNKRLYWVDTLRNIASHITERRKKGLANNGKEKNDS